MRVTTPIGSPLGYSEGRRSVSDTVPRVTTRSPTLSRAPGRTFVTSRSFGFPAPTGSTTPKTPVLPARAETPAVVSLALVSVNSVTCAAPLKTAVTRPTAASSFMTGWPTGTPSLEPLSSLIVEYQTVGEVAMTRPVLAPYALRPSAPLVSPSLARRAVSYGAVFWRGGAGRGGGRAG